MLQLFVRWHLNFPLPSLPPAAEHTDIKPWRSAIRVQRGQVGGTCLSVCQTAAVQSISEGRLGHLGEKTPRARSISTRGVNHLAS